MEKNIEKVMVIAPKGKICSKELSKEKITDSVPVSVPNTSYYRSRLAEGSLLIYTEEQTEKKTKKT